METSAKTAMHVEEAFVTYACFHHQPYQSHQSPLIIPHPINISFHFSSHLIFLFFHSISSFYRMVQEVLRTHVSPADTDSAVVKPELPQEIKEDQSNSGCGC